MKGGLIFILPKEAIDFTQLDHMLIDLKKLQEKYNITSTGVIHLGAHGGEERQTYLDCGFSKILWIEANPVLAEALAQKLSEEPIKIEAEPVINAAIFSEDDKELEFNITNNGESSSLLKFGTHQTSYPSIVVTDRIAVKTKRIDTLLNSFPGMAKGVEFANLDIQGVELEALKGFGIYLEQLKWIYSEINLVEVYENNGLIWDIDRFLLEHNFIRKDTRILDALWGDAFYVKVESLTSADKLHHLERIAAQQQKWGAMKPA